MAEAACLNYAALCSAARLHGPTAALHITRTAPHGGALAKRLLAK